MFPTLTRLIAALCIVSLVGCTTLRPVAERGAEPISAQYLGKLVAASDKLVLTRTDGSTMHVVVSAVRPDAIEGVVDGSAQATVLPLDQVRKIERREIDGTKTTILVIAIVGALYLIIEAAGASAAASLIG